MNPTLLITYWRLLIIVPLLTVIFFAVSLVRSLFRSNQG